MGIKESTQLGSLERVSPVTETGSICHPKKMISGIFLNALGWDLEDFQMYVGGGIP
jgi:hypothetical protein